MKKKIIIIILISILLLGSYYYFNYKKRNISLTICFYPSNFKDFYKKNIKEKLLNILGAGIEDIFYPPFYLGNFELKKIIPNYFILSDYKENDSEKKVIFILKKDIITNNKIKNKDIINYFNQFNIKNVEIIKDKKGRINIKVVFKGLKEKFMWDVWVNRLVYIDSKKRMFGIFKENIKIMKNQVKFKISYKEREIDLSIFFHNDIIDLYKDYLKNNYDMVIFLSEDDIMRLGNVIEHNIVRIGGFSYWLLFNTKKVNIKERKYLYNLIQYRINQVGDKRFIKNNLIYDRKHEDFFLFKREKKVYKLWVWNKDKCIEIEKLLSRYLKNYNISFKTYYIDIPGIKKEIKDYDIIVLPMIHIFLKERINQFFGPEYLGSMNFSFYVSDLILSGEIDKLDIDDCRKKLCKELKDNKIGLRLTNSSHIILFSDIFNKKKIREYEKTCIIYKLLF